MFDPAAKEGLTLDERLARIERIPGVARRAASDQEWYSVEEVASRLGKAVSRSASGARRHGRIAAQSARTARQVGRVDDLARGVGPRPESGAAAGPERVVPSPG